MLFNSWTFGLFFALVLPLYYALDWRRQNIMLLFASYVFYGWWDWRFLILLMLSTVVDFFVAKWLNATTDPSVSQVAHALERGSEPHLSRFLQILQLLLRQS